MKKGTISYVLSILLVFSLSGVALSQDVKKVDAKVGWTTLDQKTLVLMKGGERLMDLEFDPNVEVLVGGKKNTLDAVRSGQPVKVEYIEQGGRKIAKQINLPAPAKKKKKK